MFSYTADKEIRTDDLCLDVSRLNGPVLMLKCHHMKGNQMFEYDAEVGCRSQISQMIHSQAAFRWLVPWWWQLIDCDLYICLIWDLWGLCLMQTAVDCTWVSAYGHQMALYDSLLNESWVSSTQCVFPLMSSCFLIVCWKMGIWFWGKPSQILICELL